MNQENIRIVLEYVLDSEFTHYQEECASLEVDSLPNHIYSIALLAMQDLKGA